MKPFGVDYIHKVLFSPDDKEFVTYDARQEWMKSWDTETGLEKKNFGNEGYYPVVYCPDGLRLVCLLERAMIILDVQTGNRLFTIPDVQIVKPFSNRDKIVFLTKEESQYRINYLNLITNEREKGVLWPESFGPRPLDISNDGRYFAVGKVKSDLGVWQSRTILKIVDATMLYEFPLQFESDRSKISAPDKLIRFFPQGDKIVTVNERYVNIWDISDLTTSVKDAGKF